MLNNNQCVLEFILLSQGRNSHDEYKGLKIMKTHDFWYDESDRHLKTRDFWYEV